MGFSMSMVWTNTMGRTAYRGPWMFETTAREMAIDYAARILASDPWREDTLRQIASIRYESGDRAGALRAVRGDIVLIGSVSGSWPDPSGAAYQASKAGLLAFARAAGFEEHGRGVRFTTVLPGIVDTPILDRRPEPPGPEIRAHMLQPEDVAAACLFAVTLPPRAHVPELTILPTALQAVGKTNVASPSPPGN